MQLKTDDFHTEDCFDLQLSKYVTFSTIQDTIIRKASETDLSWICNLGDVCDQFCSWKNHFPKIQPLFSLNSFNNTQFLEFVRQLGVGFICTDKNDLLKASESGLEDDSIFFNNKTSLKSNIKIAASAHKNLVHCVQNERDIKNLVSLAPFARTIIDVGDEEADLNSFKSMLKSAKNKDLNVIGLKCDLANCRNRESMKVAFENLAYFLQYAEKLGYRMQVLDLGEFQMLDTNADKELICEMNNLLDSLVFSKWSSLVVVADVSRVLMGDSSFSIITTVQSIQREPKLDHNVAFNSEERPSLVCKVNDGVYGSFVGLLGADIEVNRIHTWAIQANVSDREESEVPFNVCGSFADEDSLDVVCQTCLLPGDLAIGDKIAFGNAGYFTSTAAMNTFELNGIQTPHVDFFIHHAKINAAKTMKCKQFYISRVLADSESINDYDNEVYINEDDKLNEHEFQVLFENLALLDQNLVNDRRARFLVQSGYSNNVDLNEPSIEIDMDHGERNGRAMAFF